MARLAVETAFPSISVALDAGGEVLLPRIDLGAKRATALHAAVQDLLAQRDLAPCDIGEILVDVGPGSYTGLRVGLAMVRTLAMLQAVTIRTAFSTDQLAHSGLDRITGGDALVCLDARRSQWFCARYRVQDGVLARISPPRCLAVEALQAEASGAACVLTANDEPPLDLPRHALGTPAAAALFELEDLLWEEDEPAPVYLMPPVA